MFSQYSDATRSGVEYYLTKAVNNFVIKQKMVWNVCFTIYTQKCFASIVIILSTVGNNFYTAFFLCCCHIFFPKSPHHCELSVNQ